MIKGLIKSITQSISASDTYRTVKLELITKDGLECIADKNGMTKGVVYILSREEFDKMMGNYVNREIMSE